MAPGHAAAATCDAEHSDRELGEVVGRGEKPGTSAGSAFPWRVGPPAPGVDPSETMARGVAAKLCDPGLSPTAEPAGLAPAELRDALGRLARGDDPAAWLTLAPGLAATWDRSLIPLLRDVAAHHPTLRAEVTAAISALKRGPPPSPPEAAVPTWLPVGPGRLGVGHRPRLRWLPTLAAAGVTDLLTLLGRPEGAEEVGRATESAGLAWHWLPLADGQPPEASRDPAIARVLLPVRARLDAGATVFVHCSAGIHRTGMIGAALLHLAGWREAEVAAGLRTMRTVTAEGVGPARLGWARGFAGRMRAG